MTAGFATLIIVLGSLGHWTEEAFANSSLAEPGSSLNTLVASNSTESSITISTSFTDSTATQGLISSYNSKSTGSATNTAITSSAVNSPASSSTSKSEATFSASISTSPPSLAFQDSFHVTGSSFVQTMEKVPSESPATESSSIKESASSTTTATIYTHSSVILLTSEGVSTSPIPSIPRLTSSLPEASVTPSLFSVEPSSAPNSSVASSNAPRRSISASNMSAQASVSISSSGMNSTESNITISTSSTDSTATSYNSNSTKSATNTATTSSAVNSPASSSTSKSESTFSASISTSSVTQLSTISASFTARSTSNTTQPDSIAPSSKTLSSSESSASKASSTPTETNVARPSIPTLISSLPGSITSATPSSTPSSASTPASQTPSSGPTIPQEGTKTVIIEVSLDMKFLNEYNNINSRAYKNLETELKTNLTKVYQNVDGFVDVRILLITEGSVICNYVVILAKNSAVTEDELKDILLNAGKETFPFKVQSVTLVRTEKPPKETLPHWALVTMIVLGVLAFVFIVVAICACVKYRKYKEPYYLSSGEIDMQSFEAVGYGNMRAKADVNASTAQRRLVASHTNPAYGTKGNLDD